MGGWIKIHRSIQDHWLWKEKPFDKKSAWIDLLLLANHKDNKFLFGNKLIGIKRGSFITSEYKLMDRWGWSKTKVRNFLKLLEDEEMIIKNNDTKKTTLTIVKYNDYQVSETTEELPKNYKETTEKLLKNPNKNDKNDKNVKNDKEDTTTSTSLTKKDINLIVDEWNKLGLQNLRSINSNTKRHTSLKARIREYSLDEVVQAIQSINKSNFLKGQNSRNWTITFDWLVKPNNFVKVIEGNYLDKGDNDGKYKSNTPGSNNESEEVDWAAKAGIKSF